MIQKLVKASLILVSLMVGAIVSVAILLWVYEDEFGKKIIMQLRESSSAEITLEDQEFSFWRSLPYVSYDLKKVEVKDANSKSILKADVLGLRLSLKSIFQKKLNLENILIQDGTLNVVINKSGSANYDIFSSDTKESEEGYFKSMKLDYTQFKRVKLHITDHKNGWATKVFFKDALLNYAQNDVNTKIDLEGEGVVKTYSSSGKNVISELPFDLNLTAENKEADNKWVFNSDQLVLYGDNYIFGGEYGMKYPNPIDIELKTKKGRFQNILKAFKISALDEFKIKGNYDLVLNYKGQSAKKDGPSLSVVSHIQKGYLENDLMLDPLEDIEMEISIEKPTNKAWDHLTTHLTNLHVTSTDLHFNSNAKIKGIEDLAFDFDGEGTLSLPALMGLFSNDGITSTRGSVTVKGLQGLAKYRGGKLELEKLEGKVLVEHGRLEVNAQEINIAKAILNMNRQQLNFEKTTLELNDRPVLISATIPNFSQNLKNDKLIVNTTMSMDKLDYEELVQLIQGGNEENNNTESEKQDIEEKSIDYVINMTAELEEFSYRKNAFEDCSFLLVIDKNDIDFRINASAYQGQLIASGRYLMEEKPRLSLNLETKGVQITQLLENFDNFDQEVIMDKNIKGGMDSKNVIRLFWDKEGNYLSDDLQVYSDITILDGQLLGVTMLYNFSKFIKLRDLMEIKFTRMHNYLEISSRQIYVPQMFIQSNAMNMTMAGEHSFDNNINYSFKFNAGQLLLNKLKKYTGNKKPLPAKKDGMFNMYFNMEGTVDEYQVENSRKTVQNHFSESTTHKYIIYEELKRAYPGITNPTYEPEEWLDFGSKFISERRSEDQQSGGQNQPDNKEQEEEFLDGF